MYLFTNTFFKQFMYKVKHVTVNILLSFYAVVSFTIIDPVWNAENIQINVYNNH